jgi:D-glycero-D-manno-heptose 1,7-bisphosphate phosphatase
MAQPATETGPRLAVFLDRDGVINRRATEGDYIRSWSEFEFLPGAIAAMARLDDAGASMFVVTNQRGVARGLVGAAALDDIHMRMGVALAEAGVHLGGIYVCPHEIGSCDCRKPQVGLFIQARADNPWIAFERSEMIGDSLADLEAGTRLGMRNWLVGEGREQVLAQASALQIAVAGAAGSLAELIDTSFVGRLRGAVPA